jgi:hypothetical protein
VIRLHQGADGTERLLPDEQERIMLQSGLPVGAALLPTARPQNVDQLAFSFK